MVRLASDGATSTTQRLSPPLTRCGCCRSLTAIFGYLTNGLDCFSDPTTIGPHPEACCRSLSTHRAENLTPVLGVHGSAEARARGVVQELCPA